MDGNLTALGRWRCGLLVIGVLAFAGCGVDDPSGPTLGEVRIHRVDGPEETDTVDARPAQALVVQLTNEEGEPEPGVAIVFEEPELRLLVADPDSGGGFRSTVSVETDEEGTAEVRIRFGAAAGPAELWATAPLFGTRDTSRFTVLPGQLADFGLLPRDTLVHVGEPVPMRGRGTDRHFNPVDVAPEALVVQSLSPPWLETTGRVATPRRVGVGSLVGRVAVGDVTLRDTAVVSGVPAGRVTWADGGRLWTGDLTRSGEPLDPGSARQPRWAPDGSFIVHHDGEDRLLLRGPDGTVRELAIEIIHVRDPVFSPDAAWIYFSGRRPSDFGYTIYRIRPDDTGLERVLPQLDDRALANAPDISPDGTRMVYRVRLDQLVIQELGGGASLLVDEPDPWEPLSPAWSPDGGTVAYVGQGDDLWLIDADGSDRTRLAVGPFGEGLAWSPDGRWIAATCGRLCLVDTTDGTVWLLPGWSVDPGGIDWIP